MAGARRFPGKSEEPTVPLINQTDLEIRRLTSLLAWTVNLAAQQQLEIKKMSKLALTDELTGLYNRRGFLTLARQQLKTARRAGRNVLLIFVDVNGLKCINDTWGHDEGDHILKETADVLTQSVRDSDIVARVGGDEFVILAQEASSNNELRMAARLNRNVQARNDRRKQGQCTLSLSFGFSFFGSQFASIRDLMIQADRDMYRKKRLSARSEVAAQDIDFAATEQEKRSA